MESPNPPTDVDLSLLKEAIDMIFYHIATDLKIKSLKISHDNNLFWDVALDEMFKIGDKQPTLGVGSVQDSCEFLANMVRNASSSTDAPALMLMHVTAALNFVANTVRA